MSRAVAHLARYEAIAEISGRMLAAARGADWQQVDRLRIAYRLLVDGFEGAEAGIVLDSAQRGRKSVLIRRILADDAAIRELASPEVARLSVWLGAGRAFRASTAIHQARR